MRNDAGLWSWPGQRPRKGRGLRVFLFAVLGLGREGFLKAGVRIWADFGVSAEGLQVELR